MERHAQDQPWLRHITSQGQFPAPAQARLSRTAPRFILHNVLKLERRRKGYNNDPSFPSFSCIINRRINTDTAISETRRTQVVYLQQTRLVQRLRLPLPSHPKHPSVQSKIQGLRNTLLWPERRSADPPYYPPRSTTCLDNDRLRRVASPSHCGRCFLP